MAESKSSIKWYDSFETLSNCSLSFYDADGVSVNLLGKDVRGEDKKWGSISSANSVCYSQDPSITVTNSWGENTGPLTGFATEISSFVNEGIQTIGEAQSFFGLIKQLFTGKNSEEQTGATLSDFYSIPITQGINSYQGTNLDVSSITASITYFMRNSDDDVVSTAKNFMKVLISSKVEQDGVLIKLYSPLEYKKPLPDTKITEMGANYQGAWKITFKTGTVISLLIPQSVTLELSPNYIRTKNSTIPRHAWSKLNITFQPYRKMFQTDINNKFIL